jgi:hypothetical protein
MSNNFESAPALIIISPRVVRALSGKSADEVHAESVLEVLNGKLDFGSVEDGTSSRAVSSFIEGELLIERDISKFLRQRHLGR